MFEANRTQSIIQLYVGEIPEEDMHADRTVVEDNIEVDGEQNLNPNAEQPQNDEAKSDASDASQEGNRDGRRKVEYDSDFDFFLDGDDLNDACDPIDDEERDGGESKRESKGSSERVMCKAVCKIKRHCATLLQRNPGSVAFIVTEQPQLCKSPIFKRIFVMFTAQKEGFVNACRPIIGLDACHLKGIIGGQLMSAIGRDANNQMFPIAMALVESECKDSWGWFLDSFTDAIGTPIERGWVFLSDRQKGLIDCIENKYPRVEHRFCVKHMYANFKLKFKDKHLRDLMWGAARAYSPSHYESKMRELQLVAPEAHAWLSSIPANLWARHTFSPRTKCDLLSNNICESFNQYIKDAREEPLLTMFEAIRRQIMCRFQEKRDWIQKMKSHICSRICQKNEERKKQVAQFDALVSTREMYEVTGIVGTFAVNAVQRSCTCNEWDMTGIPCVHACAGLVQDNKSPYVLVRFY
ncbi:uncharacterized protein LOC113760170 [Coffea eugenioides]|uniref:uncharacterized protein LOC113760170 n=1 Tax=Coffea eugenioides TaxID=49369 RepID=UPI000F6107B6|nr:uncharacterized protein LOC113760170 [Coffea eugenioides]